VPAARTEKAGKNDDRSGPRVAAPPPPDRDTIPDSRFPTPHLGTVPPPPPDQDAVCDSRFSAPYRRAAPPPPEPSYQASAAAMRHEYRASRAYTVAEGETLFTIARYELGKASRWVEIYELNRDALGNGLNELRPGTKLLLPVNERPEVLAEPAGNIYRR
jgi:nucleoid-associated protein YgaU